MLVDCCVWTVLSGSGLGGCWEGSDRVKEMDGWMDEMR
jgi:hypothetical protein